MTEQSRLSIEDAARIVRDFRDKGERDLIEQTVLMLAERAILQDRKNRERSMKGAQGQRNAAIERRERFVSIAQKLIKTRTFPFFSYRQLAEAVQRKAPDARVETIRKHLAEARILDP